MVEDERRQSVRLGGGRLALPVLNPCRGACQRLIVRDARIEPRAEPEELCERVIVHAGVEPEWVTGLLSSA